MKLEYLILFISILLSSCNKSDMPIEQQIDTCELTNAEKQFLTEESNSYFFYEGYDKAIFKDADNNEHTFLISHSETKTEDFLKYAICGNGYENIHFKREVKEVTLTGPEQGDHRIVIRLTTGFHDHETNFKKDHLVDIMRIIQFRLPENGGGSVVGPNYFTSNRGGSIELDSVNIRYTELDNYEAFGSNFGSVIKSHTYFTHIKPIYYSKIHGVVALHNIAHNFLVFDRLE